MGSYKSYPVEYDTFGKMLALKEEKKNENQKRNYFGLEDRFRDPNKQKKKLQIPLGVDPGPGINQLHNGLEKKQIQRKKAKSKIGWKICQKVLKSLFIIEIMKIL